MTVSSRDAPDNAADSDAAVYKQLLTDLEMPDANSWYIA